MKKYNRIMLGKGGMYADECRNEGFIGIGFLPKNDLSTHLPDEWKLFNQEYIPVYQEENPGAKKISAGLSCGYLWTVCKGLQVGDIVLTPNGRGQYYVGEIISNYYYMVGENLPHRRKVRWFDKLIERSDMSEDLRHSTGAIGTCCDITKYQQEIDSFLTQSPTTTLVCNNDDVENPSVFALEKHLEDFLVKNWIHTELGKKYDIYEEKGELVGEQYPSDTGPIDILAQSKDKKTWLVIELKRGRASDVVVGQIQRYMGYIKEEVAEIGQNVKGVIIGLEADNKLKRALSVCTNIEFYQYKVDFKLHKSI